METRFLGWVGLLRQAVALSVMEGRAVLLGAVLVLVPVALVLGLLAQLLIGPLYGVVQVLETQPTQLFEVLDRMQLHALLIYSGLFGLGLFCFYVLVVPIVKAAMILTFSARSLGHTLKPFEVYYNLVPVLRPLLSTVWLKTLRVGLGLCCLILPGLVLMVFYGQAELVTLLEGRSGASALRRSQAIMERWEHLVRFVMLRGTVFVLGILLSGVLSTAWDSIFGTPAHFVGWTLRATLPLLFLLPLEAAAGLMFYSDVMLRQRAFGLSLDQALQADLNDVDQRFIDDDGP